ncbi:Uncharacterised protein [Serratia plymuthica]|nr:Uncharacterised protein [Serratia plymuthica]
MLMSKAAYAKHCGVSRQTIYDRIARGELVLVGSKIDVEVSKQRLKNSPAVHPWHDPDKKVNISPRAALYSLDEDLSDVKNQPFAVSIQQAADMVLTLDDIYPPAETEEELRARVLDAADSLGLEVRTVDIDGDEEHIIGIELYDAEQDKTVVRFDSYLFELEALTFLRWLVVTKRLEDTELEHVTKAGLAALSEPFVSDVKAVYVDRFESDADDM